MTQQYSIIFNTCPDDIVAKRLAALLVEKKLAACVNILPGVASVYSWKGNIETDQEVMLLIKTRKDNYAAVEAAIRDNHPYELPEVVSVSMDKALPEYLSWISENTAIK